MIVVGVCLEMVTVRRYEEASKETSRCVLLVDDADDSSQRLLSRDHFRLSLEEEIAP